MHGSLFSQLRFTGYGLARRVSAHGLKIPHPRQSIIMFEPNKKIETKKVCSLVGRFLDGAFNKKSVRLLEWVVFLTVHSGWSTFLFICSNLKRSTRGTKKTERTKISVFKIVIFVNKAQKIVRSIFQKGALLT